MKLLKLISDIIKNKSTLYCIQVEPFNHPNPKYDKPGFIIHFHRRKNWTIFGYAETVNTSYYLSPEHSFRVFQLLHKLSEHISFHMHSKNNWIIDFYFNYYVEWHI